MTRVPTLICVFPTCGGGGPRRGGGGGRNRGGGVVVDGEKGVVGRRAPVQVQVVPLVAGVLPHRCHHLVAILQRRDDLVEVAEEGGQVGLEVVKGRVLGHAVVHGELAGERVVAALVEVRDVVGGVDLLMISV